MKKVQLTTAVMAMAFLSLSAISCKDAKKEDSHSDAMHSEMNHDNGDGHHDTNSSDTTIDEIAQSSDAQSILNNYMLLKDALVNDDNSKAKELGGTLAKSLKSFDISSYSEDKKSELKDILEDATEHAEHIGKNEIKHQREHFKTLSKDIIDMVAVTGTETKLYEQFCPMYDGGSAWLSTVQEVRNPYYGSQMLKCGKVQREIN